MDHVVKIKYAYVILLHTQIGIKKILLDVIHNKSID